jgi:imidazolonepropionase-like amidohydrolase
LRLLIDDVQLWDGTGRPAQPRIYVEVSDGRTRWIGSASDWRGSRTNVRVIDGRARTLIPGLMGCHVHYSSPGGPDWIARFTDPLPEISMWAVELAEASLRGGVTTARDVGAPHGVSIGLAVRQKRERYVLRGFMRREHGLPIVEHTSRSQDNSMMRENCARHSEPRLKREQT